MARKYVCDFCGGNIKRVRFDIKVNVECVDEGVYVETEKTTFPTHTYNACGECWRKSNGTIRTILDVHNDKEDE